MARPAYKRKVKNYLLDVGLQLRYTATIVSSRSFLTAGLGYQDVPGDARHLEGDPVDRAGRSGDRRRSCSRSSRSSDRDRAVGDHRLRRRAGAVDQRASASCSRTRWRGRSTRSPASSAASATTGWARRRRSCARATSCRTSISSFREMHQAVRARVEEDVRVLGSARRGASRRRRSGSVAGRAARARRAAPAAQAQGRQPRGAADRSDDAPAATLRPATRDARRRGPAGAAGAQARRVCAALTRQRPCRNRPGRKQQA